MMQVSCQRPDAPICTAAAELTGKSNRVLTVAARIRHRCLTVATLKRTERSLTAATLKGLYRFLTVAALIRTVVGVYRLVRRAGLLTALGKDHVTGVAADHQQLTAVLKVRQHLGRSKILDG